MTRRNNITGINTWQVWIHYSFVSFLQIHSPRLEYHLALPLAYLVRTQLVEENLQPYQISCVCLLRCPKILLSHLNTRQISLK